MPESVCAKPCEVGEFHIQGELTCCWDCRRCRQTEYVKEDCSGCDTCPLFHWPEQTNFSSCESIAPTYIFWTDPLAIALEAFAGFGILCLVYITFIFLQMRNTKVVRGSSRELMIPIIIGMYVSYLSVFAFLTKPVKWACYANYFGFHLSCTLILGPLFLKSIRLYRIFKASGKLQHRVGMVDGSSQVMLTALLIAIEVRLSN